MNYQLNRLIHTIVSDYRSYVNNQVAPRITDLESAEQKLILSYLADEEEYLRAISHPTCFAALITEYKNYVDELLTDEFNEQYVNALYDGGLKPHVDKVNGEVSWY